MMYVSLVKLLVVLEAEQRVQSCLADKRGRLDEVFQILSSQQEKLRDMISNTGKITA